MTETGVVYRPPADEQHKCQPPLHCPVYAFDESREVPRFDHWRECHGFHDGYGCPNGQAIEPIGTVWCCPECTSYWTVYLPENHPASRLIVCYVPVWRSSTWLERHRARKAARRG